METPQKQFLATSVSYTAHWIVNNDTKNVSTDMKYLNYSRRPWVENVYILREKINTRDRLFTVWKKVIEIMIYYFAALNNGLQQNLQRQDYRVEHCFPNFFRRGALLKENLSSRISRNVLCLILSLYILWGILHMVGKWL